MRKEEGDESNSMKFVHALKLPNFHALYESDYLVVRQSRFHVLIASQVRLYMILQPYSQVIFIDKSTRRRFLIMLRTIAAFHRKITMVEDKKKTNQTETGGNLRCCPI